jgi:hypothetical protein
MAFAAGCTVRNVHFTSQRQHFLHRAFATMIIEGVYSRVPPGNSRGNFDFGQIDSFDSLIVWASCHKFWGCIGNIFQGCTHGIHFLASRGNKVGVFLDFGEGMVSVSYFSHTGRSTSAVHTGFVDNNFNGIVTY